MKKKFKMSSSVTSASDYGFNCEYNKNIFQFWSMMKGWGYGTGMEGWRDGTGKEGWNRNRGGNRDRRKDVRWRRRWWELVAVWVWWSWVLVADHTGEHSACSCGFFYHWWAFMGCGQSFCRCWWVMGVVFLSPVKSSFFLQNEATGNRNWSKLIQIFRDRNWTLKDQSWSVHHAKKTGPDQLQLVFYCAK